MAKADAVEELFLRGEWWQALEQSRLLLNEQIQQERRSPTISTEEERLVAFYLQSIFELDQHLELDTATTIIEALEPLPCTIAIQWIKFLIAMDRKVPALDRLQELLEHYHLQPRSSENDRAYQALLEVFIDQFLLPTGEIETAQQQIQADDLLDDDAKAASNCLAVSTGLHGSLTGIAMLQRFLRHIDKYVEAQAADPAPNAVPASSSSVPASTAHTAALPSPNVASSADTNTTVLSSNARSAKSADEDNTSDYLMMGGTALALGFAVLGAVRYRGKLHEAVSEISKSLADARHALFEA